MQVLYPCCCGLDIHKRSVSACLFSRGAPQDYQREIRTFGTTRAEREHLSLWLRSTAVPMSQWRVPVRSGNRSSTCSNPRFS